METEKYETSDIALATFLYCSATYLSGIDRTNPGRCIFVFDSPKPELISKWQEGKANVNALVFYNAYQALKAKLFGREIMASAMAPRIWTPDEFLYSSSTYGKSLVVLHGETTCYIAGEFNA